MSRARGHLGRGVLALLVAAIPSACESTGAIAPSYPGTLLLVAEDTTSTLAEIEPNGGRVRYRYPIAGPALHIATSRNGQFAATIDARGEVTVCDLVRQGIDARFTIEGGTEAVGLAFVDRRSTLAVAFAHSGDIVVFGRESGRIERRIPSGSGAVRALCASADRGDIVAACAAPDRLVRIDVEAGRVVESVDLPAAPLAVACPRDFTDTVVALESEHGARLWRASRPELTEVIYGRTALAVAHDGETIVASEATTAAMVLIHGDSWSPRLGVGSPESARDETWSTAIDPIGRNAFLAIPGENRVVVVDVAEWMERGAYSGLGRPGVIAWTFQRVPPEVEFGIGRR